MMSFRGANHSLKQVGLKAYHARNQFLGEAISSFSWGGLGQYVALMTKILQGLEPG